MTEEKRQLPHEVVIGLLKDAQKDFRDMIGAMKELNETIQAVMLGMSGAVEEKKEEEDEVSDSE